MFNGCSKKQVQAKPEGEDGFLEKHLGSFDCGVGNPLPPIPDSLYRFERIAFISLRYIDRVFHVRIDYCFQTLSEEYLLRLSGFYELSTKKNKDMKIEDFEKNCPSNAHISGINLNKEKQVLSARGYNILDYGKQGKGKIPGTLALVWNKFGEAYSRDMELNDPTSFRERNRVIVFEDKAYQRDPQFDIHFD